MKNYFSLAASVTADIRVWLEYLTKRSLFVVMVVLFTFSYSQDSPNSQIKLFGGAEVIAQIPEEFSNHYIVANNAEITDSAFQSQSPELAEEIVATQLSKKWRKRNLAEAQTLKRGERKECSIAKPHTSFEVFSSSSLISLTNNAVSKSLISKNIREWNFKCFAALQINESNSSIGFDSKIKTTLCYLHRILNKYSTDFSVRPPPLLI